MPRRFLQVVAGPRQTGKITLVRQVADKLGLPQRYASADGIALEEFLARPVEHWLRT